MYHFFSKYVYTISFIIYFGKPAVAPFTNMV